MLRTGVEGFYVAMRGSVEDYYEPKLFFSEKALWFVKEVLEIKPQQLALKFEAWCVSGLSGHQFTMLQEDGQNLYTFRQSSIEYSSIPTHQDYQPMSHYNSGKTWCIIMFSMDIAF
jgi:hypothetical protein